MCVKYVKDISRDFVPNIFNLLKPAFYTISFNTTAHKVLQQTKTTKCLHVCIILSDSTKAGFLPMNNNTKMGNILSSKFP